MPINLTKSGINSQSVSKFVHSDRFREILTWTVPPVTPLFRYALDKKDFFEKTKEKPELQAKKKKLLKRDLVRDISILSVGTALYFASLVGIDNALKKTTEMSRKSRKVTAFLSALAINVAYVSAGATKISQIFLNKQKNIPEEFLYSHKLINFKSSPLKQDNPFARDS